MAKSKLTLEQTEKQVPKLAKSATGSAYKRAVRLGGGVLVYWNGELRLIEAGDIAVLSKNWNRAFELRKGLNLKSNPNRHKAPTAKNVRRPKWFRQKYDQSENSRD